MAFLSLNGILRDKLQEVKMSSYYHFIAWSMDGTSEDFTVRDTHQNHRIRGPQESVAC